MNHDKLKILIVGKSADGKTQLINRYFDDKFDYSLLTTIGVDFKTKIVDIDGIPIKLQMWDAAGVERFANIVVAYFRNTDAFIVVCDVNNKSSIESANFWIKKIREEGFMDSSCVVLVGTKIDLKDRKISKNEAKEFALENGLHYFEVSAKTGEGVDELFYYLATSAYHLKLKRQLEEEEEKK